MTLLFQLGTPLVMVFWLLMVFAPGWRWTQRVAASPWIIIGPALIYSVVVLPRALEVFAVFNPPTLDGLSALLATPEGTLLAWMHFLAFDLFVGRWIYLDSRVNGVSPWLVGPLLFRTSM
ncbi:MAG: ABA4-like family protein [Chloroflexota bacterium]